MAASSRSHLAVVSLCGALLCKIGIFLIGALVVWRGLGVRREATQKGEDHQ
jgi:hypothetical protein